MSRISSKPVIFPDAVSYTFNDSCFAVKGPKGQLSLDIHPTVEVKQDKTSVLFSAKEGEKLGNNMAATMQVLVGNMVVGVFNGFNKQLILKGVGYRVAAQGKSLKLTLGFSHEVLYALPEGIEVKIENPTQFTISGIDKQKVGQVAAEIRALRPPEAYKGKGVRYADEVVRIKETKKSKK